MNRFAAACLVCVSFGGNAFASPAGKDPVEAFTSEIDFCAYMVSPPGSERDQFIRKYEAALRRAIDAMRLRDGEITTTRAIFSVRRLCDATLSRPMSIQP